MPTSPSVGHNAALYPLVLSAVCSAAIPRLWEWVGDLHMRLWLCAIVCGCAWLRVVVRVCGCARLCAHTQNLSEYCVFTCQPGYSKFGWDPFCWGVNSWMIGSDPGRCGMTSQHEVAGLLLALPRVNKTVGLSPCTMRSQDRHVVSLPGTPLGKIHPPPHLPLQKEKTYQK